MIYDVIIIGAGASGLMCAINAKNSTNKILILEKNNEAGKKIKITGNGRCNYYNDVQNNNCYHCSNDSYKDIILNQIQEIDIPSIFNNLGIEPIIKDGYYYPYSNKAITVRDTLLNEVISKNIEIKYEYEVKSINKNDDLYIINNELKTKSLVLATGGITYQITGSTGDGYEFASQFGHTINKLQPVLGKLGTTDPILKKLKGIRTHVKVSCNNMSEEGELQLNEDSISGICVFNITKCVSLNDVVEVNFIPFTNKPFEYLKDRINKLNICILDNLSRLLNNILAKELILKANIDINKIELSDEEINRLSNILSKYEFKINKLASKEDGQVTSGGVDLDEVNLDTYESKLSNNLFIIGEVLDIDGICGGYNLTNAWNSGIRAGKYISKI